MINLLIDRFQHPPTSKIQTGLINHLAENKSRISRFGGYSTANWQQPTYVTNRYPLNVYLELDYD